MFILAIGIFLTGFTQADNFTEENYSIEEETIEMAKCSKSSQCFSFEYCDSGGTCVDASKTPCLSSSDCVAGESCNLNVTPHKCR